MTQRSRIAVGAIETEGSPAILWGLLGAFRRLGIQVQTFLSQACFPENCATAAITGLAPRHLDSWLMPPDVCRHIFNSGARGTQLAIVEGTFQSAGTGSNLETICQWLDLPRIAIIDARRLGQCKLPPLPESLDGILLDHVAGLDQWSRDSVNLEAICGVPVLGALEALPRLREQVSSLASDRCPSPELWNVLGNRFVQYWKPELLMQIAQRDMPRTSCDCSLAGRRPPSAGLTVAIAYDEAFNRYFPDTLDALEARGASVVDFSPLRDETLPPQADIVYLGCGHPERFAGPLSENHCMATALRSHLCAGRRIYGEGGGAAYLCQHLETPDGKFKRMAGVLPAVARYQGGAVESRPVELVLSRATWLGCDGTMIRGYRNRPWRLEPVGRLANLAADAGQEFILAGNFLAVGSLAHLDFAAQPSLLDRFFHPQCSPAGVFGSQPAPLPPF